MSGWKKITRHYQIQSAKRSTAGVAMTEHGDTETNAGATIIADKTAVARGIDPSKPYLMDYFVDEKRGVIGAHAVANATPGTIQTRRYKRGRTARITFHLGAAFEEYPDLRPKHKEVHCHVTEEVGDDGLPIMVIAVVAGIPKITQSRKNSGSNPGSQTAASENP